MVWGEGIVYLGDVVHIKVYIGVCNRKVGYGDFNGFYIRMKVRDKVSLRVHRLILIVVDKVEDDIIFLYEKILIYVGRDYVWIQTA